MEAPASILFFMYYFLGNRQTELVPLIFLVMWQSHYLYRAFIYPFTLRGKKDIPIIIMFLAVVFNLFNAYLQAQWIYTLSPITTYTIGWLKDPRFIVGIILFFSGYIINKQADSVLRNLRKPGEARYRIPKGRLYNVISCPNYFGEIIEWVGWAIAVWSLPGALFAFWTIANLLPRARSHHSWYKNKFPDYPANRKALLPFVY
jgi:steroid 5-alpha reductase family enzyme